jgi:hypothetical protein
VKTEMGTQKYQKKETKNEKLESAYEYLQLLLDFLHSLLTTKNKTTQNRASMYKVSQDFQA